MRPDRPLVAIPGDVARVASGGEEVVRSLDRVDPVRLRRRTPDLGGRATTDEVTAAVINAIRGVNV